MDHSTPPKAPTKPKTSPPSIPSWFFSTPETGSTSHLEGPADGITQTEGLGTSYGGRSHAPSMASTFMIHRLYDADNDDNGANPFKPRHSGCPSSTHSSSCGSIDDDTSPNNSPCKGTRFVDATIRPVTSANTPVSVDSLCFTSKPALPPIRTSMSSDSSLICHVRSGPSTGSPSPPFKVSPLSRGSTPRRNGEDQPNALGEHTTLLEKQLKLYGPVRDVDEKLSAKPSFKSRLRRLFHSKASKILGLVKRSRNLWK